MAISRAQIPEQIDVFQEGGDVSSNLTPEEILALYGSVQSSPVTSADIQIQAEQMAGLFPQPRKQNLFDLASAVGAGLVGAASDPRGLGAGLTAGFQQFNERAEKIKAERDKIRQEVAMLAYQQVEARRQEQLEKSQEVLKMQFEYALENAEGVDFGSSTLGKALAYIAQAEKNPQLKNSEEYKIAVAIAKQPKTQVIQTETGAQTVTVPGLDVDAIFAQKTTQTAPQSLTINNTVYQFTGKYDANNDPIYKDPTGKEQVIKAKQ